MLRTRVSRALVVLAGALAMVPACQPAAAPPSAPATGSNEHPRGVAGELLDPPSARTLAAAAGSHASSFDDRGRPTFLWATGAQAAPEGASHEQAARHHLARHAAALGLSRQVVDGAELRTVHDLKEGGVIAQFGQRVQGVEVYHADLRMILRANHELVAISGNLHDLPVVRSASAFSRPATQAVADALSDLFHLQTSASFVEEAGRDQGDYRYYSLSPHTGIHLPEGARVKRVYFPDGNQLTGAYWVEFYAGRLDQTDSRAWRYLIGAEDGRVLERTSLSASDSFNYRVWAWSTGDLRPTDGPFMGWEPHPTGKPDGTNPPFIAPVVIAMDSFNTTPLGHGDSWLAKGSVQTVGNNVDAYADRNAPDGFSNGDFRATSTAASTFDRTYDVTQSPVVSNDQAMAAITQLFYNTNWLHDWFYDSGFDEKSGNAQFDNMQRGGLGNDVLHAEAQDYGGRDNANMNTPDDGMSPRMQMYLWDGPQTAKITLVPGGTPANGTAAFGPASFNVTAAVVLVNDNSGTVTDACQAITNNVTGKIALIDRGTCSFKTKALNAQNAGAIGMLLANNAAGNAPAMGDDANIMNAITIGSLSIAQADGNALKAALMNGAVNATLYRKADPDRDGSIDNMVVAHEWGHYLHHRLAQCGSQQCSAMSEGWADFNALMMMLRSGDDLNGTYGFGIYASKYLGDSGYYGIRRQPYSQDLTKDGLTFKMIGDGAALPNTPLQNNGGPNSEVHNAGEVWATMMFDTYLALQKNAATNKVPFETMHRTMTDYIVAGLKLTPLDATYTEQRDAVLAAISARSQSDLAIAAAAFARRGAGSCAVSPARDSQNLQGVVEDNNLKAHLVVSGATLDDAVLSCDNDGHLDAAEIGNLTVQVSNAGPVAMNGTKVTVTTMTNGVTFPNGASVTIAAIAPYATANAVIQVALDKATMGIGQFDAAVQVDNAATCEGTVKTTYSWRTNYDDLASGSATDDVESEKPVWKIAGQPSTGVWAREVTAGINHAWHGVDYGSVSDTTLESPDLQVSANAGFSFEYDYRYHFETDLGGNGKPVIYYDGGVIEVTTDGGVTWVDLSKYVDPKYGGTITNTAGNPLTNRMAFVNQNAAWPMLDHAKYDLGMQLAGKTIRVRFHLGSDQATSDFGILLDNLAFTGIDNKPFSTLVPNRAVCAMLVADAGPDQTVDPGAAVVIDASRSSGIMGRPLAFAWTQTAGTPVTLVHGNAAVAAFVAPALAVPSALTFQVTVSDGQSMATAVTHVLVNALMLSPDMASPADMASLLDMSHVNTAPDLATTVDQAMAPDAASTPAPSSGCSCRVGDTGREGKTGSNGSLLAAMFIGAALLRRRSRAR